MAAQVRARATSMTQWPQRQKRRGHDVPVTSKDATHGEKSENSAGYTFEECLRLGELWKAVSRDLGQDQRRFL